MVLGTLNAKEVDAVAILAAWFRANRGHVSRAEAIAVFEMSSDEYEPFIRRLEHFGAVRTVSSSSGRFDPIWALAPVVSINDHIEQKKQEAALPPDRVDQIFRWLRSKWIVAFLIVLFTISMAVVGAVTTVQAIFK